MLRVYCIHPTIHNVDELLAYLRVEKRYELEWDNNLPDILFASEWIYYKKEYFDTFKRLWNLVKIKVFLAYEAISPDWNLFDYAIGFDDKLINDDRFIRIVNPFILYNKFVSKTKNEIDTIEKAYYELQRKEKFCNFLYSNANAHEMRDRLFYEISKYKRVDSLGRHLNNVGGKGTGFEGYSMECVPLKRPYKFSIASENASYSGYTSEKLLTSLEAHTVPIYFGNPCVCDDFNPCCFINASDFVDLEELVGYICKVDMDDDLWCKIVSSPWMTQKQIKKLEQRTHDYYAQIERLLSQDFLLQSKIAQGTHQNLYRKHFFESVFPCDYMNHKYTWKYYVKWPYRYLKSFVNK